MHVAYIHQHFSTTKGATGTRSYEMSKRLLRAGHQVTLICGAYAEGDRVGSQDQRVAELDIEGIRVLRIDEPYGNRMGFVRRLMAFWRFARSATRVLYDLQPRPDLIFATSTPLSVGIPALKGARRFGVPFVFEVRDLWPDVVVEMGALRNPIMIAYARWLERRLYHKATRVVALAPGIKDGICRTGVAEAKVPLIPNSSDVDLFVPTDEPLADPRFGQPDDVKFVFTGAHGLANGLDGVLDMVAELKRRGEKGVHFAFIGDGSQKDGLKRRAREDGLAEYLTFSDPVPKMELAQLLPRFDVGMMVLRNIPGFHFATSPNKFFDYIACGLPVLNNYPGWLAGMIEEHRCGRVTPPDNPKAFADAVLWFRDHRDELPEMGKRGRALAKSDFDRDLLADKLVATLEEVHREHVGAG